MFCLNHLAQLGRMYDEIQGHGAGVLGVGGASQEAARKVMRAFRTPFPILADPQRTTYADYGLSKVLIIQQSGTFLIDRGGTIRYLHRATNPQRALRRHELRAALRSL